jgi:predicted glycoside hydrolase/deacetylase ChbG (UPF0249 family)
MNGDNMRKLIVNADDLGLTPGCNQGIIRTMTAGIVTDTTLMINTDHAADAVVRLKAHGLAAGLHLNLTCGRPLLPGRDVPSLVDAAGAFHRPVNRVVAVCEPREAERELAAQVDRFLSTGLTLTHLDSHHHAHSYPELLDVAIGLARTLGVPLRQTGPAVRARLVAFGIPTPDAFTDAFYGSGATAGNLRAIIAGHAAGVLEIMCHPAAHDDLLPRISSYSAERQRELAILTDPAVKDFIASLGIELVGFAALKEA